MLFMVAIQLCLYTIFSYLFGEEHLWLFPIWIILNCFLMSIIVKIVKVSFIICFRFVPISGNTRFYDVSIPTLNHFHNAFHNIMVIISHLLPMSFITPSVAFHGICVSLFYLIIDVNGVRWCRIVVSIWLMTVSGFPGLVDDFMSF